MAKWNNKSDENKQEPGLVDKIVSTIKQPMVNLKPKWKHHRILK